MSALRDMLSLPAEVKKSDYVVRLTEGVTHPKALIESYAVTPDIARNLDLALGFVNAAIREKRSEAAYIHGSFGAGKSHFMGVLSLLLANDATVWGDASLHELRAKHEWVKTKKILRLHFHMVGARSSEEKIFPEYIARIRELHPEAPVPSLFEDEALFDNAQKLRGQLGDEKFFAGLAEGSSAKKGWGKLGEQSRWDAASFDRARSSPEREDRDRLFSALVKTHFPAFAQGRSSFVGFDVGLGRLSRHAAALGYDAVVLFLDELILWLASRAGDKDWIAMEVQKLAKLVEAQDEQRAIPIVSYIARQRDISEMVGDQFAGVEVLRLKTSLGYWDGRFNKIELEDRNLPTVVEKRVVRARDAAAKTKLDQSFDTMRRGLGQQAWGTLLGRDGDEKAFRQVYPFSPALIEALVSLSHYLQRERTALKVLVELLVDHLEDFEMGKVVPIGDLFDALAGGEEPMDGHMRERFLSAKRLYQIEFLPRIQADNGTGTKDRCQRLRDDHPIYLGCSNCREARCRADNRLVKTLLLAALIPERPVLQNLTVSRLVQLNHGTLKSPIPGQEASMTTTRLRAWNADIGKLRLEGEGDPRVFIVLEGVDVRPIIEAARGYDSPGARRKLLRDILYEALEIEPSNDPVIEHKVTWRGTKREGVIQYGNVREMDEAALIAPPDADFKIVIDYPFDDTGFGPEEDEQRLDRFRETHRGSPTVVWIPSFFGERVNRDLQELVIIKRILDDTLRAHFASLRPDDQRRAREELEHLASQKRGRVRRALEAAYGLKRADEGDLDSAHVVDKHIQVLWPGWEIRGVTESVLARAVPKAVEELLDLRYPRHPHFAGVTTAKLKASVERLEKLAEADNQRIPITKAERGDWEILEQLRVVDATEAWASLRQEWVQDVDKVLRQDGLEKAPTIDQVRKRFDPNGQRGLMRDLADLEVMAYAIASRRELLRGGSPVKDSTLGKLAGDIELIQTPLPDEKPWQDAIERAGQVFGVTPGGRARNARNLRQLFDKVKVARDAAVKEGAHTLADLIGRRGDFLPDLAPRLVTAERVTELLARIDTRNPVELAHALGTFEPVGSSWPALAKHVLHASKTLRVLGEDVYFNVFQDLRQSSEPAAKELVDRVRQALGADELTIELAATIPMLSAEGQRLRHQPVEFLPMGGPDRVVREGGGDSLDAMADARRHIEKALSDAGPGGRLIFHWKVVKPS